MSSNSCRLVVTYHSDIVRQRLIGAALEPLLHRALARSSAVIATSQRYLDSSPVLGLYRDRCHVVPNAVQIERFDAPLANEVSGIKQRFGSRIVLTVGRLVYYKGLEYLIDAMVGIDAKLLIIGDGPFRTKLQRQIARLGLQERVIMMGEVDDVVPYYQAADVFALPSIARSEAFGIVQVEAMACGKPVVNTHLDSGVPFVSVHGSTGITVESRNSEALGNAIVRLLNDSDLRAKYGRAAQRRVRDHFTAEGAARQHLDIYQRVMGRAHPGRVWSRDSQESAATNIAR